MLPRQGNWSLILLLGLGALFFALLLGAALGAGLLVFALLLMSLPLLVVGAVWFWNQSAQRLGQAAFWSQFLLFYFLGIFFGVTGVSLNGAWQVLVFAGGLLSCWLAAGRFRERWLAASLFFLLAYHAVALVSLVFAPSVALKATAYQLVSNLKLFALFGFVFLFSKWVSVEAAVRRTTPVFILLCLLALALQWAGQGLYSTLFPNFMIPVESTFYLPSPGIGIFHHASILAGVSAVLGCYYFACFMERRQRRDLLVFFGLVALLLASNQRQEMFSFFIAITALYFFLSGSTLFVRSSILLVTWALLLCVFVGLFWESILRELPQWGIGTWQRSVIPRYQLYDGAWSFAREYFPLGRGLGAYGGVGAMKYDLSAYFQLGLTSEWWWRNYNHYLLDAYWPNAIGEGGYFGVLFMGLHYACLLLYFVTKGIAALSREVRRAWLAAAAALLWVLGTTPTSPGFQEIVILYFPAVFWVIAERLNQGKGAA